MARGRPRKEINWKLFDNLCKIQASLGEISAVLDISEDTIERIVKREKGVLFSEYFETKKGYGRAKLRKAQAKLALGGNPTMLIWLGKQWLGQKDRSDITSNDQPFTVKILRGVSTDDL